MSKTLTFRIEDELNNALEAIAKEIDRDKTYIMKKAITTYINEYADYQIALDRLNDKDDPIISFKEMEGLLDG